MNTLEQPVEINGLGLHSGAPVQVTLVPRDIPGVVLVRRDLLGNPEIPAAFSKITRTTHATTLEYQGASVSTLEHLLAALWASEIGACRVELNAPEIPILDGSALIWCEEIQRAGVRSLTVEAPVFGLREPVWVEQGNSSVLALPHHELRVSTVVEYDVEYARRQMFDMVISPQSFFREIAPARTFTLESWLEPLRAAGLIRGGSLDNAVVLHSDAPSSPWRFPEELARHKILDLIGDVALLFGQNETDGSIDMRGARLQAHFIAVRAGHELHRLWMQACVEQNALMRVN